MDKSALTQASRFIGTDIAREVALADASDRMLGRVGLKLARVPFGGGNFVAALALLAYTEFAGRLKNNDFSDTNAKKNFNSFFEDLGPDYKHLLTRIDVYKIFRCGLAHEYYVKEDCVIAMRPAKPRNTALGMDNGRYFFIVEQYRRDFMKAFTALCSRLQ